MKNHTSTKSVLNITSGTVVVGKWHNKHYKVIKELGAGATGTVFLVKGQEGLVALKMSANHTSISSEVNILKKCSKVQGLNLGPSLIDVDDWIHNSTSIPFYTMDYIQGSSFISFIEQKGTVWLGILISQLLKDLHALHQEGFIFGDLKPDNLLVVQNPFALRWIDVGGITQIGRSIKEFTEFFDRGYWGLGTRTADPTYDLFSVAMIMVNVAYPNRFEKKKEALFFIRTKIKESVMLKPYELIMMKALERKYKSAMDMRKDIIAILNRTSVPKQPRNQSKPAQRPAVQSKRMKTVSKNPSIKNNVKAPKKTSKSSFIGETVVIITFIAFFYFFYIYTQIL